jgi:hypothetical protein
MRLTTTERNPRKLKWTKSFRKAAGKEMTVDSTLAFAARRNVPIRYNRDLMAKTVQAISRVEEIRAKRELLFYKSRMAANRRRDLDIDRKLVAEHQHLLPPGERDVPPIPLGEMDLGDDMDEDMWEGLDAAAVPSGMDVDDSDDEFDEDEDEDEEDIEIKKAIAQKKAMSSKKRTKMAVDGSTAVD